MKKYLVIMIICMEEMGTWEFDSRWAALSFINFSMEQDLKTGHSHRQYLIKEA